MPPRPLATAFALAVLACSASGQELYLEPTRIQGTAAQKQKTVAALRRFVLNYAWRGSLPGAGPSHVGNVEPPIVGLKNVGQSQLLLNIVGGARSKAYHLVPAKGKKNYLVVMHHGHACSFDDDANGTKYGMKRTIQALLDRGYSVLAAHMPAMGPGDCQNQSVHNTLPMEAFLEPLTRDLNYLQDAFPEYDLGGRGAAMAGLSGGGWMSSIYPAIDTRITRSFDVSGSMPLSLRGPSSMGDNEQYVHEFYKEINYLDLYVMAAWGGRRHTQIMNVADDCCFGDKKDQFVRPHPEIDYVSALTGAKYGYKGRVVQALGAQGFYDLVIDWTADGHVISPATTERIIDGL